MERIAKKFELKIEIGKELENDTWALDVLENKEFADRLRKAYTELKKIPP